MGFKIASIICLVFLLILSVNAIEDEENDYLPLTGILFVIIVFIPLLYVVLH